MLKSNIRTNLPDWFQLVSKASKPCDLTGDGINTYTQLSLVFKILKTFKNHFIQSLGIFCEVYLPQVKIFSFRFHVDIQFYEIDSVGNQAG